MGPQPSGDLVALQRFYDTEYHFDTDVARPDPERLVRALRLLEPLGGRRVLDLGCGVGWMARLASASGAAAVVGLDFSARAVTLASRTAPDAGVVQADGSRLPFPAGSFDRVVSFGSLEHFPDVAGGLAEVRRVLVDDGMAVLVVPNVYVRTEQPQEHRDHYLGWRRLIRSAGLEVVKVGADRGPRIRESRGLPQLARRTAGRLLSLVPGLQYQFVLAVRPQRG